MNLDEEQREELKKLLKAAAFGKRMAAIMMGMPPSAWHLFERLFGQIAKSGFLKTPDDDWIVKRALTSHGLWN
ncbi:unnamed protein product [Protopolystoma xenopodis]|uniref:Uncharacterized protein n=1 Tax=Protopolystoma xenopodis TaxID=117903 RepID=A0A3S5FFP8_9PLAT|nr:unnamed protein product [Protopolystoma xenopodis]